MTDPTGDGPAFIRRPADVEVTERIRRAVESFSPAQRAEFDAAGRPGMHPPIRTRLVLFGWGLLIVALAAGAGVVFTSCTLGWP